MYAGAYPTISLSVSVVPDEVIGSPHVDVLPLRNGVVEAVLERLGGSSTEQPPLDKVVLVPFHSLLGACQ